jgi:alcohol dehydrogenase
MGSPGEARSTSGSRLCEEELLDALSDSILFPGEGARKLGTMTDDGTAVANRAVGTMRAARLEHPGAPLTIEAVPPPSPPPGGVRIRVEAAQVLPFSHAVLAGEFPFALPTPYTFGSSAVGVVEEAAEDVTGVCVGERVFCDPYLPEERPGREPAPLIIGWFGLSDAARPAQRRWRDGAFAEYAVYPAECCTPLTGLEEVAVERLACMNYLNIAYGGLLRGGMRAGETVIITGATGNLGTAAVLDALAMGAGCVVAAGRNREVLDDLLALDPRVVTVSLAGDAAADAAALRTAACDATDSGAELFVDCVGLADSTSHLCAGVAALRRGGTVVLIGGVSGAVELEYQRLLAGELTLRGSFMGSRSGPAELAALARSGQLRLDVLRPRVFELDAVQQAVEAAREGRGLEFTVLRIEDKEDQR